MAIEYFWCENDFLIFGGAAGSESSRPVPDDARPLSFTEFRDLVQCRARGGRLVTLPGGRPAVRGREKPVGGPAFRESGAKGGYFFINDDQVLPGGLQFERT